MKCNLNRRVRDSQVGPGGWKCPCCGPAPRHRKKVLRAVKKKTNRLIDRIYGDTGLDD